jgi:hypothetical protein
MHPLKSFTALSFATITLGLIGCSGNQGKSSYVLPTPTATPAPTVAANNCAVTSDVASITLPFGNAASGAVNFTVTFATDRGAPTASGEKGFAVTGLRAGSVAKTYVFSGTFAQTGTAIVTVTAPSSAFTCRASIEVVAGSPPLPPGVPPVNFPTDTLLAGQALMPGQSLRSANGMFTLTLQATDGNLVLIGPNELGVGRALWSTITGVLERTAHTASTLTLGTLYGPDSHGTVLLMQTDANLVLYNGANAGWHAQTYGGSANARVVLQDDGNVVVYDGTTARWSWMTGNLVGRACGLLKSEESLTAGSVLVSCDRRYILAAQTDGNLVVYGPSGATWSTWTDRIGISPMRPGYGPATSGTFVKMQSDGNLVLYDSSTCNRTATSSSTATSTRRRKRCGRSTRAT